MNEQQAKDLIRLRWRDLYPRDKSGKGIICPLCGNGNGSDGDGIVQVPPAKVNDKEGILRCFKCKFTGDVLSLIQKDRGISFPEALQLAADTLHITIDEKTEPQKGPRMSNSEGSKATGRANPPAQNKGLLEPKKDYSEYFQACAERIEDPAAVAYLYGRGISIETAKQAGIGYDPKADPAESNHHSPRIIIPCSKAHYIGRSIDPNIEKKYAKLNNKGSTPQLFNEKALWKNNGVVFICEGSFDALSFIEAGTDAVALNSTSNTGRLLEILEKKRTDAALILCLDNDDSGRRGTAELKIGLSRLNISYQVKNVCKGHNDPNEALCADPEGFTRAIKQAIQEATKPENVLDYIDTLLLSDIDSFSSEERKTGFKNLDKLAGGLYPGLYVLAATSSLGKTTFVHQMADQLAEAGNDVLYFSMEQSRLEMVSKSLARELYRMNKPASSLEIRKKQIGEEDLAAAAAAYTARVGNRLSVIEGNFNCDEGFIEKYARRYVAQNNARPILIVDYLQILTPPEWMEKKHTTKDEMDQTVTALKRLSRELNITIIVISSINRNNYLTPIDFESIKESGGIEYTCDVVWGLQLQCLGEELFNTSEKTKIAAKRARIKDAKAETPRKIELCCLKNRYGISSYTCGFYYYPASDLFTERPIRARKEKATKDIPEY